MRYLLKSICFISAAIILLCDSPLDKTQWKGKIEYEDGVKVIKNSKELICGEIALEFEEDLIIGSDVDENQMFFRGVSAAVDSEQNIYVRDSGNSRVQKFDKHGNYLQTIGKKGQGPGEFEIISGIFVDANDSLYVKGYQRVSIFDKTGKLKGTIPLGISLIRWAIMEGGNILGVTYAYGSYERSELKKNVVLIDSKGIQTKTIASFFSQYGAFMIDGVAIGGYNPYAPMLDLNTMNDHRCIYAWSPNFRLYIVNSRGELLFIIDKDEPQEKITQKEKTRVIENEISFVKKAKHITLSKNKVASKYKFPEFKPHISSLFTDDSGNIYVFKLDRDSIEKKELKYDLFNQEGYYVFRVIFPQIVPSFIKNGCIYTVEYVEDTGYAKIKRYKIKNWDQIKTDI